MRASELIVVLMEKIAERGDLIVLVQSDLPSGIRFVSVEHDPFRQEDLILVHLEDLP